MHEQTVGYSRVRKKEGRGLSTERVLEGQGRGRTLSSPGPKAGLKQHRSHSGGLPDRIKASAQERGGQPGLWAWRKRLGFQASSMQDGEPHRLSPALRVEGWNDPGTSTVGPEGTVRVRVGLVTPRRHPSPPAREHP